jgi:hypothetical protein
MRPGDEENRHNGLTLSLAEWARRIGLTRSGLNHRLERGWSVAEALADTQFRGLMKRNP